MSEYDEAFAQMGAAPLELDEAQPTDRRRYNRGTRGNRGGGRKHARTKKCSGLSKS